MQQSNVIFGSLFIAFIVFITSKGELVKYISLLKGTATSPSTTPTTSNQPTSSMSLEDQAMHLLQNTPGIQINQPPPP